MEMDHTVLEGFFPVELLTPSRLCLWPCFIGWLGMDGTVFEQGLLQGKTL